MLTRQQIRSELLAAYKRRRQDRFQDLLLRCVTDPVEPLTDNRKRRFHPLLVTAAILVVIVLITAAFFSR